MMRGEEATVRRVIHLGQALGVPGTRFGINSVAVAMPARAFVSLLLALIAVSGAAAAEPASEEPPTLTVEARGSVPGIGEADLAAFVATQMREAGKSAWRFAPAAGSGASKDRVEWSFATGPSAVGAVRTYGYSRAMMERLVGAHHYVTIKARLYLHGDYQTETLGEATIGAGPDPALAAEIATITRLLLLSTDPNSLGSPQLLDATIRPMGEIIP